MGSSRLGVRGSGEPSGGSAAPRAAVTAASTSRYPLPTRQGESVGGGGLAAPSRSRRVSSTRSGRPAASNTSATAPVTWGAAMLVPDFRVGRAPDSRAPAGAERAASTRTPGASTSGLVRPSRVGPCELNGPGRRSGSCAS